MGIQTTRYVRKPLIVDAVQVTKNNFEELAQACGGKIHNDKVRKAPYIEVPVHNPRNKSQTKAYVGDWLLRTQRGLKIYTDNAFQASFDKIKDEAFKIDHTSLSAVLLERMTWSATEIRQIAESVYREMESDRVPGEIVGGGVG